MRLIALFDDNSLYKEDNDKTYISLIDYSKWVLTEKIPTYISRNSLYPKNGYGKRILWGPTNVYGIQEQNSKSH